MVLPKCPLGIGIPYRRRLHEAPNPEPKPIRLHAKGLHPQCLSSELRIQNCKPDPNPPKAPKNN